MQPASKTNWDRVARLALIVVLGLIIGWLIVTFIMVPLIGGN